MQTLSGTRLGEWKRTNYVRYRAIVMAVILVGSLIFYTLPKIGDGQRILSLVVAAFCLLVVLGDFRKALKPAVTVTLYSDGLRITEGRRPSNMYQWADVASAWWPGLDLNKQQPTTFHHTRNEVDEAIDTARTVASVGQVAASLATGGHFKDQLTLVMSDKRVIQLDNGFQNVQTLIAHIHELLTDAWAVQMQGQLRQNLTVKFGVGSLTPQALQDDHNGIPWANITDTKFTETMGTLTVGGTDHNGTSQTLTFDGVGLRGKAVIKLIPKMREQLINTPQQAQ